MTKPARTPRNGLQPVWIALALSPLAAAHAQTPELALMSSRSLAWPPLWTANLTQPAPSQATQEALRLVRSERLPNKAVGPGAQANAPVHWASQAPQWLPGQSACDALAMPNWDRLSLGTALAVSMCKSPSLRQALASVAEQTAGVSLVEVTQRPQWSANVSANSTRYLGSNAVTSSSLSTSIDLSWVLFDFGQRDANLTQARQTLAAAMASQSNTVLDAIREMVQLYGEAVVADAARSATTEAENTASITANVAQGRYRAGVGNQIERLQARTALAQATLARVRAESDWENTRGRLALALGADIAQPLRLSEWAPLPVTPRPGTGDLATLRAQARAMHPRLKAAQARIDALKARLQSVEAGNQGSVSFSASGGNTRSWGTTTTSSLSGSSNAGNASLGLVATLPLFNARESQAQQAQVVAQIGAGEAELEALQREIDTLLWQAHRAVITSEQNLEASERLLEAATSTYEVAQGRYKAGVGSVLDVLTAQTALADARRQNVAARVDKLNAQTQLSLATGRMAF